MKALHAYIAVMTVASAQAAPVSDRIQIASMLLSVHLVPLIAIAKVALVSLTSTTRNVLKVTIQYFIAQMILAQHRIRITLLVTPANLGTASA